MYVYGIVGRGVHVTVERCERGCKEEMFIIQTQKHKWLAKQSRHSDVGLCKGLQFQHFLEDTPVQLQPKNLPNVYIILTRCPGSGGYFIWPTSTLNSHCLIINLLVLVQTTLVGGT